MGRGQLRGQANTQTVFKAHSLSVSDRKAFPLGAIRTLVQAALTAAAPCSKLCGTSPTGAVALQRYLQKEAEETCTLPGPTRRRLGDSRRGPGHGL